MLAWTPAEVAPLELVAEVLLALALSSPLLPGAGGVGCGLRLQAGASQNSPVMQLSLTKRKLTDRVYHAELGGESDYVATTIVVPRGIRIARAAATASARARLEAGQALASGVPAALHYLVRA